VRLTAPGTQTGEFGGIPATGKQAAWTEMRIGRIVSGAIADGTNCNLKKNRIVGEIRFFFIGSVR
jgi:predicted ester cyclase